MRKVAPLEAVKVTLLEAGQVTEVGPAGIVEVDEEVEIVVLVVEIVEEVVITELDVLDVDEEFQIPADVVFSTKVELVLLRLVLVDDVVVDSCTAVEVV